MVTKYPHPIASHSERSARTESHTEGRGQRVMDWLRQAICGMHGHDTLLQFEQERMFLRCVSCGHETPGWELNAARPNVTIRGDARRHAIVRPQLIGARRIA